MIESLQRVCALQPSFSWRNTATMEERGNLIRTTLRDHLWALRPRLAPLLKEFGDDFGARGSDGMVRKTPAPWVGFHSKSMSPNPRTGFYSVIHFSADGSAFWVTIGCAGTVWNGQDFQPLSKKELHGRTAWMRNIIVDHFGSTTPFDDTIKLGARGSLPRAFERATAVAQRFDPATCTEDDVLRSLEASAKQLCEIYRAQKIGSHLSPAQVAQVEVEELVNPLRPLASGQGLRMSAEERRAIELRAMTVAKEELENLSYVVTDCSRNSPFDYLAKIDGKSIKIEVKGTTSADCSSIFMTKNEVSLHRDEFGTTALIIVSDIKISGPPGSIKATGGICECQFGWDINSWDVDPIAFVVRKDKK